jgi:hypothetical protein
MKDEGEEISTGAILLRCFVHYIFHFPFGIFHLSLKKSGSFDDKWNMENGKWKMKIPQNHYLIA